MKKILISSVKVLFLMTLVTGIIYPLLMTAVGQILIKDKAEGSFIYKDGKAVGSLLIGQQFEEDKYFWSRPSAVGNNPMPSGGSNLGPTSKALADSFAVRKERFVKRSLINDETVVPAEMFFASASGVDPHITPASAYVQVERVARSRNFNGRQKKEIYEIIRNLTEQPQIGFLGEERINVLLLNLETDKIQ